MAHSPLSSLRRFVRCFCPADEAKGDPFHTSFIACVPLPLTSPPLLSLIILGGDLRAPAPVTSAAAL